MEKPGRGLQSECITGLVKHGGGVGKLAFIYGIMSSGAAFWMQACKSQQINYSSDRSAFSKMIKQALGTIESTCRCHAEAINRLLKVLRVLRTKSFIKTDPRSVL